MSRLRLPLACLVLPLLAAFHGPAARAGSSNSLLDLSADGRWIACAVRDGGTLSLIDRRTNERTHLVPVGKHPEGVTFLGDSNTVAVAVYGEDAILLVDAATGERTGTIEVFDEPYGLVSNSAGTRLYATLCYPGQVVEIDVAERRILRTIDVGQFVRGLAITADDARLFVTEYHTSVVHAIDLAAGTVVDAWPGTSSDNLARQIVVSPRRPKAYLSHIRSRVTSNQGEGSIFPYVSVIDTEPTFGTESTQESRRKRMSMDSFVGARVTANPWEIALSPDGRDLYVVFAGTNDLFACTVIDDDYRELEHRRTLEVGNNPRAVRVAPDGRTLFVYNALDFEIVEYDTETLRERATIGVCENPLTEEVHAGKVLFYSALQPMVGRRWISCSSCHPDGEADGRTWQNPEGLRNTQPLGGMAWTHPIHWSADRDEVQDFEHTIRGPLMGGRGLFRGTLNDGLGTPNRGLSQTLDALAAYSNTHVVPLSPHAKHGLSDAAERGREVFHARETRCAECHSGPWFTDSQPRPDPLRHDVGTGDDDPTERMGPAYDTPTLLGVYRSGPYLHHGRAESLRDVLVTCNEDDRHGVTSHLTDEQLDDLVEYLRSLPYEDPEPAARRAGLTKVER
jgi:DNA-binding beta-propeller fold protein YncE